MAAGTCRLGFQSTPPVKAATIVALPFQKLIYISIHAAREGGDCYALHSAMYYVISIHAAREGGDDTKIDRFGVLSNFNPRRP